MKDLIVNVEEEMLNIIREKGEKIVATAKFRFNFYKKKLIILSIININFMN